MLHNSSRQLRQLPVLASLPSRALKVASTLMTPISFPAGKVLCREGDVGREAFLIVSGSASVRRGDKMVAMVGPGDIIGERALLGGWFRNATVVTDEPVTALVMSRREIASLLALPGVAKAVDRVTATR